MVFILEGAQAFVKDDAKAIKDLQNFAEPMQQTNTTIMSRAKQTVPRDTGLLAMSHLPSVAPMETQIANPLIYAPVIHGGWRAHGIEANPWLVSAGKDTEHIWIQYFETALDEAVNNMDKVYAV